MSGFCEPPPQGTSPSYQGQDWLYRLGQFLCKLFPLPISQGGTGQITAQKAINALTQVAGATPGYVLTKNVSTGNADWEAGGGGGGAVSSVSTTDPALTIAPTTGAVIVSTNDFVGDSGSGGVHGEVPAPASGDGAAGKVLKADGTWGTAGTASPLTTKGDIYVYSTMNDRLPVGTNTYILSADSSQTTGLLWIANTVGTVTSVGLVLPTEFTVTVSPITSSGSLTAIWAVESVHTVFAGPSSGSPATPTFRTLVAGDIPALAYVTSVGLSLPAEFTVTVSPITSSGTLTAIWAVETANTVFAGPTTGSPATPAFRALVAADIPALSYVTSVGLAGPTGWTISGSPVTSSGTLTFADPLSTKGDLLTRTTTTEVALPVGTDTYVLTADSAQTSGIKWAAIPVSGTLQSQEFTTPGANTFNVPTGVTAVWITMAGGGGGGSSTIAAATGGGGGGAGELCVAQPAPVASGGTVTVTVGSKGTGAAAGQVTAQVGVAGGDTSFGSVFVVRGGLGGTTAGVGGAGGGPKGSTGGAIGNPGAVGTIGVVEATTWFSGGSGAGGGSTTAANGGAGAPSGGYTGVAGGTTAGTQAGAGSGASTIWGQGGQGGNGGAIGNTATAAHYGSGGGGGGGHATTTIGGGDGAPGYCLVMWVA